MKQPPIYDDLRIDEFKKCFKFYYNLKYENKKLKIKDISFFTSGYGPYQYLRAVNKRFAETKMRLPIENSMRINWMLDKYFRFDFPDDLSRKGLEEYFDNKSDDIRLYLHHYRHQCDEDEEMQEFTKSASRVIAFGLKYNRYDSQTIPNLITEENFSSQNIKELLREYFLDCLQLQLAYLFVNIKLDSEILTDLFPKKAIPKSFKFTKSADSLQMLYSQLIKHRYIQDVEFTTFHKHFSESEINENEKLVWTRTNVLLAFFIKLLQDKDYLSVGENIWQKTETCFKDQKSNSLTASLSRNCFPKGYEELETILSSVN